MAVKGVSNRSRKTGIASIPNPKPRHAGKDYKENYEKRRIQNHPSSPTKRLMIMKGTSKPVGAIPGVGRDRDSAWRDYQVPVLNESIMEGRGCRRNFHREQPNSGPRR